MSILKENSTSNVKPATASTDHAADWEEARLVYPLYYFLATHFKLDTPLTSQPELPVACPREDVLSCVTRWLHSMDARIRANQLRQLLHSVKDIKAENLRAVILRLLRRPVKTNTDRDNIDLLLATYFALCAPEDLYACEATLPDVALVLSSVLPDADATPLEWCGSLDQILDAAKQCRGLRDLFAAKFLEKGRELKDAAGFMFYDPAALVAFTRFNFLMRRSFFRLLHADLRAIREGLSELERRGTLTVDCQSAGLTTQEPVGHLREISLSWRQPIRSDYASESANHTFKQLLAIRGAVDRALGIATGEMDVPPTVARHGQELTSPTRVNRDEDSARSKNSRDAAPNVREECSTSRTNERTAKTPEAVESIPVLSKTRKAAQASTQVKTPQQAGSSDSRQEPASTKQKPASSEEKTTPQDGRSKETTSAPSVEFEQCLEDIWEQLIEAPPARGRSMGTVNLGGVRILLSAWEVNAFVSDGGQLSTDLRRAVTARAMVVVAREEQKHSGDAAKLAAAISQGRQEMTYLQDRVEQAQRAKNTEAAVNLGISARRLLSAIEQAQAG